MLDQKSDEEGLIDYEDMDDGKSDGHTNPMAALLASAKARAADYEEDSEDHDEEDDSMNEDDPHGGAEVASQLKESSRHAYDKIYKSVLDSADIVLYVLDARNPNGTRSREIERQIMAVDGGSKRLILILNKIDLIPPPVLKSWLVYLRRYFPTLPLRANNPAPNARTWDHKALTVKGTSETLLRALKTYAHAKQLKRSTSVGVIGYPNVGKSSVINALTSRLGGSGSAGRNQNLACPVGAEAGITTSLREVKIDNKLKLLDSPGIVFPSDTPDSNNTQLSGKERSLARRNTQANLILLNAIPPKQITDPIPAITLLLQRLSASQDTFSKLLDLYGLPPLMSASSPSPMTTDFLIQVARKRGRLGKGGVPNILSAAMTVLSDWRDGRIQGWVDAPVLDVNKGINEARDGSANAKDDMAVRGDQKEIVKEWAEEFKLEGLWGDDRKVEVPEVEMGEC